MKSKMLLGTIAIVMATVVAPVANAGPVFPGATTTIWTARFTSVQASGRTATGGCFFATANAGFFTGAEFAGVIGDVSATQGPGGIPMAATVVCGVLIDGSFPQGTVTYPPGGAEVAQAGADELIFSATEGQSVELCEDVRYADGFRTGFICQDATETTVPAQEITDVIGVAIGALDPLVCPAFASLVGTYPLGPFTLVIEPDGDIYINGGDANRIYDCPPY